MTTPKPEATMPAIAEALADEIDDAVLQAVLAASASEVVGLPFGERCKARAEISRIAADRIRAALRADPTAGAQGTGARGKLSAAFFDIRDLADDIRYRRHEPHVLAASARAIAEEVRAIAYDLPPDPSPLHPHAEGNGHA